MAEEDQDLVDYEEDEAEPTEEGKGIKEVTARLIRACDEVQKVLKAEGSDFMHNDHLGWVIAFSCKTSRLTCVHRC